MTEHDKKILEALFPVREIDLRGVKVKVRPVSLEDLPKAIDALDRLIAAVKGGVPREKIVTEMLRELISLVPYSTDFPMRQLPGTLAAPELLKAILELNVTDDVVGKWKALAEFVTNSVGDEMMSFMAAKSQGEEGGVQNKIRVSED
mgnify:CR=1 FL=1